MQAVASTGHRGARGGVPGGVTPTEGAPSGGAPPFGAAGGASRLRRARGAVRAAVRSAVFVLKALPMLPSGPVDRVTQAPVIETLAYPTHAGGPRPTSTGPPRRPHPGVLVSLGVVPVGVEHPQSRRLGQALARSGLRRAPPLVARDARPPSRSGRHRVTWRRPTTR